MTPSDFELHSHPEFAKTHAYHFATNAKIRPLGEKKSRFFPGETIILTSFDSLSGYIMRKNGATGNFVDFVEL